MVSSPAFPHLCDGDCVLYVNHTTDDGECHFRRVLCLSCDRTKIENSWSPVVWGTSTVTTLLPTDHEIFSRLQQRRRPSSKRECMFRKKADSDFPHRHPCPNTHTHIFIPPPASTNNEDYCSRICPLCGFRHSFCSSCLCQYKECCADFVGKNGVSETTHDRSSWNDDDDDFS